MSRNSKNFLIYSASAGSGKTFTLVSEYLGKILETGANFSQVLAITFTNKATAEMKARILSELNKLATGQKSDHLNSLKERLSLEDAVIRSRASVQLKRILHDYSSFSVSTIDSYFQVLTRILTRELKLPVKFDIELNENKIQHETAERLLDQAGFDVELTQWLRELLFDKLEQGKGWKIQPELRSMTREVIHQDKARALAGNTNKNKIKELIIELNKIQHEMESSLREIGVTALEVIFKHGKAVGDFSNGSNGAAGYFQKILQNDYSKWEPKVRVQTAVEDPLSMLTKQKQKDQQLRTLTEEILHPLLCQAVDIYHAGIRKYISAVAVRRFLYYSGIIPSIGNELKKFRDENNVFLLSDTTRLLKENISGQDAPFIYEKSGIRFRHVFIDEFQDTSTDQWNILLPLARNTLGNGDQLLLVGDAKQSIYRWRGGNIHLIRKTAADSLQSFKSNLDQRVLHKNWRSSETIVQFNNRFFPVLAKTLSESYPDYSDPELLEGYSSEQVNQDFKAELSGKGYMEFAFFDGKQKGGTEEETVIDSEEPVADTWREKALFRMKQSIEEVLASGYQPRDIAILFRNNSEEPIITSWLLQHTKFPFISSNSLKIDTYPSVRFILNCLLILCEKEEPVNRVEAAEFLIQHSLQKKGNHLPHQKIKYFEPDSWINTQLLPLKKQITSLQVNLFVKMIREKAGLYAADPFLDAFEDKVNEYTLKFSGGIADFTEWWEELSETKDKLFLEMPDTANAIRMLSVHKSKGLEFPVVIIPFCDWEILPKHRTRIWASSEEAPFSLVDNLMVAANQNLLQSVFSEDYIRECKESIADNLNLAYVAFTRPKDRLYLFSNSGSTRQYIAGSFHRSLTTAEITEYHSENGIELFYTGNKSAPVEEKKKLTEASALEHPIPVAPSLLQPVASLTSPLLAVVHESREINFGKALHAIIASSLSHDDLPFGLHRYSLQYSIPVNELEPAASRIMDQLFENGWLNPAWKVFAETDFCDANGNIFRPDRVLSSPTETVILDFKSGAPDPDYLIQVRGYCKLLEDIGFPVVKGYLIYPASDYIQAV